MDIERLKNISIIAACLTVVGIVGIGGGFALIMIISSSFNGVD